MHLNVDCGHQEKCKLFFEEDAIDPVKTRDRLVAASLPHV